jgi:TATA-binding protein-associated factor
MLHKQHSHFTFFRLRDSDDDVRSVSASTLLPVASSLVTLPNAKLEEILLVLWESVVDLTRNDLTAATSYVMDLLGDLIFCRVLRGVIQPYCSKALYFSRGTLIYP